MNERYGKDYFVAGAAGAAAGAAASSFFAAAFFFFFFFFFVVFAGAFSGVAAGAAAAGSVAGAAAFSSANAVPRVRANATAVNRAIIFFIRFHLLSIRKMEERMMADSSKIC
jgi:hypothetical protein